MQYRWWMLIVLALLLSGCGERVPQAQDLEQYANGLPQKHSVLDRFGLRLIFSASDGETVHLEVRKRNPAESVSEEEIAAFKKALYAEYGREFPLEIRVWTLPEDPSLDGRLTGLDGDRILVVADRKDADSSPRAMWLQLNEDSIIIDGGTGESMLPEQLQIGIRVKAWSEAVVAESYPEQSGLMRLEVTNPDAGQGDVQGTIEKIETRSEDAARELTIDGKTYRMMGAAIIRIEDQAARFENLREGDRVSAWFAGYEIMPGDAIITQITVTR